MRTPEEQRAYCAAWRKTHPGYGRELRAYRRVVEGEWRAEFMAKSKATAKPLKPSGTAREAYPWENDPEFLGTL